MKKYFYLIILFAASFVINSCQSDAADDQPNFKLVKDYDYRTIYKWNQTFLEVERYATGYRPGPAPRGLAYMGLAAYEACVSGMPDFNSFSNYFPGLHVPEAEPNVEYCWPIVINASYEYLMFRFFDYMGDEYKIKVDKTAASIYDQYKGTVSKEVYDRSVARGLTVGQTFWEYSTSDAIAHEHYKNPFINYDWRDHYKKAGDWEPTTPGPGEAVGGVWGKARSFTLNDNSQKICRPPSFYMTYSESPSSEYYSQALEVYSHNTPALSYEDQWVAEFWSDDIELFTFSPGPRILAIGNQLLQVENTSLETGIFMSAKVGMAICDASIGAWASKYYYNIERPVTYINKVLDPNWKPHLSNLISGAEGISPSFPAYPSGHSTMGSAGAEALASIFGYDYAFTDRSHYERTDFLGNPRSFPSFYEMALEDAWSRIPLGVHWRMDCEEGVRFGTEIGRRVNALPWKKG